MRSPRANPAANLRNATAENRLKIRRSVTQIASSRST
jgi:hypothetical protein